MHNFRVPPSHSWYTTPVATPDHGVLYIAGNHSCIAYIPSPDNASGRVQMIDLRYQCKAVASDTNWDDSRWLVTLKENNELNVWDLDTATIVRGHRAHCVTAAAGDKHAADGGAVCVTANRQVLTIAGNGFAKFCLRSNTYSMFREDFVPKKRRHRVTVLRPSPYATDLLAMGYNDGLVEIVNVDTLTHLRTFNGHKTSIVSMEWMQINPDDIEQEVETKIQRRLIADDAVSVASSQASLSQEDVTVGAGADDDKMEELTVGRGTEQSDLAAVGDLKDLDDIMAELTVDDDSGVALGKAAAGHEAILDDDQAMTLSQVQESKSYLATGAEESLVYIWDTKNNVIAHTIRLKTHGRHTIPKPICMLHWITTTELVIINPNGTLSQWKIKRDTKNIEKCSDQSKQHQERGIIGLCGGRRTHATHFWTFSIFHQIILHEHDADVTTVAGSYGTLPIGMYSIRECPHDLNKIAIGGNNKRIGIVDTLTMAPQKIDIQWLTADIQGNVRALAWHPLKENVLSFSTDKSRVGTFDLSKPTNPNFWFNGKQAYRIAYGVVDEKATLYAYNDKGLTMYSDGAQGQNKGKTYDLKTLGFEVCSISICDNYICLGTQNGVFKLFTLDFTKRYEKKLSSKYISDIAWQHKTKRHLAVCNTADGKIHLFECNADETTVVRVDEAGVLIGHGQGVTWIKWSNQSTDRLVSTGFDNTVRVWNTQTCECLAVAEYNGKMYCAIFLPGNDDFIAASGQAETLHVFDLREMAVAAGGENKARKSKLDVCWGVQMVNGEIVPEANIKIEKKNTKKSPSGADIEQAKVANERLLEAQKTKVNSILNISNREINRDAVTCLVGLLKGQSSPPERKAEFLIANIVSKDQVQFVIEKELRNMRTSSAEAIGNILLPQMNNDLKSQIIARTEAKLLTPQLVSLAPSISFEFWRKCSLAYAFQTIEKGNVLDAVPHLLAIYQITEAIDALCQNDYYREAWLLAKMQCDHDDRAVFERIATQWLDFLEYSGNFEGAALTAYLLDTPQRASEILQKRKITTLDIDEALALLQKLIANNAEANDF